MTGELAGFSAPFSGVLPVTFTAEELKALDVESSKVIDLDKFVPRNDIDPVYFDTPYYVYPDGPIAVETLRVIGAGMAEAGVVGLGRLTLSRRERMVMIEPRGTGMALFTLRAAAEVRASQFGSANGDLDAEMVAIAGAMIKQRTGKFDPKPRVVSTPTPVIDLMAALKRSLSEEAPSQKQTAASRERRTRAAPDRRQAALLLPLSGGSKRTGGQSAEPTTIGPRRRGKSWSCVAGRIMQDWNFVIAFRSPLARFLALYGALYAAFGVQSPYLPSLLDRNGLPPEAIAWYWPPALQSAWRPGRRLAV
jgi:DNA end-binding protein Ku